MTTEEYQKLFHNAPPAHIVKKRKVVCPVCLKNSPQIKQIFGATGLFACKSCMKKQSQHAPMSPASMAGKMDSLSPEEILNGVQHGYEYHGPKSTKTWSEERKEAVKDLREVLK